MSNPKWEIGPVKLVDGSEAWIYFVQPESNHQRYIGKVRGNSGEWCALHWCDSGRVPYTTTGHAKNLAPPPKKTVRVRFWVNIYPTAAAGKHESRESADKCAADDRIACIEIDRVVEEGEGL